MRRIVSLDYIRALAMCGVLMIHSGSYALLASHPNAALIAVFEILTRFSIPIFFFVSAFGLFVKHAPDKAFSYWGFLKKRLKTIFIPYLVWSMIYIVVAHDYASLQPLNLTYKLFFGLGSYQLYFLVILIWFYILMPLWRIIIPSMAKAPVLSLSILFLAQMLFNYYSVNYLWNVQTSHPLLNAFFTYRVSYWVAHYIFVFVFGGIAALHAASFRALCARHLAAICAFILLAAANIIGYCAYYQTAHGYTLIECINTFHQLSIPGEIYTLAATLFTFAICDRITNTGFSKLLTMLANASFTIYLVHPLFMYGLAYGYSRLHIAFTTATSILFFLCTLGLSYAFARGIDGVAKKIPLAGILLRGT